MKGDDIHHNDHKVHNFSSDFDKREKKIEDAPEEIIKQFLPIIQQLMTKPKTYKVTMDLSAQEMEEVAKLAQTWKPTTHIGVE